MALSGKVFFVFACSESLVSTMSVLAGKIEVVLSHPQAFKLIKPFPFSFRSSSLSFIEIIVSLCIVLVFFNLCLQIWWWWRSCNSWLCFFSRQLLVLFFFIAFQLPPSLSRLASHCSVTYSHCFVYLTFYRHRLLGLGLEKDLIFATLYVYFRCFFF